MGADRKDNVDQDSQPTWQELLDLVAQLTEGDYESVAVSYGSVSVRLSKSGPLEPQASVPDAAPERPRTAAPTPTAAAATPVSPAEPTSTGATITAPMLGVFYRRPSPGAEPFVEPGDEVAPDTTIGIIEIMKLMNPVTAGVSGVIATFDVQDGTSVEFGQTLARLEPAP
jgi:acetyl-CoA carboxylase biotin carboxyl carrier protein